ncbi:MAG: Crp/Fnr family transcriptional regulator [Bacteroidota bacterium]|nr:Crp/Fnr family transcriptional regulator [Bacteroidota bacterium]
MKISPQHLKLKFPDIEPELLDKISEHSEVREINKDDVLVRTGQHLTSAMIVLSGAVKIYREGDNGGEFLLYYLQNGQACAMSMSCLRHQEKSQVMGVAVEDSEILMIPMAKVNEWVREYRSWQEFVINTYRNRFEEVLSVLDSVAFRGMDERLEFYLKKEADKTNSNNLSISHQSIANDLNTSREVVSRLLKKMEQRGLVVLQRNKIDLLGEH